MTATSRDRHLPIVANAFYAVSAVLGVPALVGCIVAGFTAFRLYQTKTPELGTSRSPDGAVDLLVTGAHVFGKAFQFMGDLGEWMIMGVAVILFFVSLLALVIFLTGRGLHRRQGWAKIVASLFAFWLLLTSVVSFLSLGRSSMSLLPLLATSVSVYALWALWRRLA